MLDLYITYCMCHGRSMNLSRDHLILLVTDHMTPQFPHQAFTDHMTTPFLHRSFTDHMTTPPVTRVTRNILRATISPRPLAAIHESPTRPSRDGLS